MEYELKKPQNLRLLAIAALLIITPLVSASLRFKYLYFIVNILIIAVGADAGLLSFVSQSQENKNPPAAAAQKDAISRDTGTNGHVKKPAEAVEECSSEKNSFDFEAREFKKSPSTPSIFFVGGGGEGTDQAEDLVEDNEGEQAGDQELFHKSETFIGNFYKQLRMQREESWEKLEDISQKAF